MNYFKSEQIEIIRERIINHSVYENIKTIEDVQIFMEAHVWAVWDFMSLLKFLQQRFTCVRTPWVPTGIDTMRQMINDIVLHEESDPFFNGQSHFQVYIKAMHEAGANADHIHDFITCIRLDNLEDTSVYLGLPGYEHSMFIEKLIDRQHVEEVAASFSIGREGLIPDMFKPLMKSLSQKHPKQLRTLLYYLERHIELDGDEHADMAHELLAHSITDNESYLRAEKAAVDSLLARGRLLDKIDRDILFK